MERQVISTSKKRIFLNKVSGQRTQCKMVVYKEVIGKNKKTGKPVYNSKTVFEAA